jgi:1-acyl-sn-glycerol-3-phosphate acyltransferase
MFNPNLTHLLAVVAVVALAATFAAAAWRDARSTGFRPIQYPLYLFGYAMTRVLWRARVVGRLDVPAGRGAVIVCNHRGPIDPAFVGLACLQQVHWMVAGEYFSVPIFGTCLKILGAVPTRRGGIDTAAIKQTIRHAARGDLVGVFPEGKINITPALMLPLRSGAVMMALEARVPIVPCYIDGSPHDPQVIYGFLLKPARTTLTVGRPIDLSAYYDRAADREVQEELTRRIGREIAALAGRPDFEPQLVARRRRKEDHAASEPEPTT